MLGEGWGCLHLKREKKLSENRKTHEYGCIVGGRGGKVGQNASPRFLKPSIETYGTEQYRGGGGGYGRMRRLPC